MAVDLGPRLVARGVPITLGGKTYRVIITFEAVELLESGFDGFDVFMEHLRSDKYKGSRRKTVRKGIVAGLIHSKPPDQDLLDFEREILDLLEPRKMSDYLDALWMAIMEAFPPLRAGDSAPKARASHGTGSTTSQLSISDEATASSGA